MFFPPQKHKNKFNINPVVWNNRYTNNIQIPSFKGLTIKALGNMSIILNANVHV